MKFPTYKEMGEKVAEQALDEYVINGKTLREWIKLLSEQEPCDDVVSRQSIINSIANTNFWLSSDNWNELMEAINKVPSVRPQEQTGHWIEHPEIETSKPEYLMFYECSECGDEQCFCKPDVHNHKKRFCGNCGAKMVEPQESSKEWVNFAEDLMPIIDEAESEE